jgi:alcohol dehydrogenase
MEPFDFQSRTRVIFGEGAIARIGEAARELGFKRTLLVADHGLVESGHVDEACAPLAEAGVEIIHFHEFEANPTTLMVEAGRDFARAHNIDSIIGLGGGSSLDCAKGINFLLTNGGRMQDYWGWGKAEKPMLPMIGIPTTAGTGSEAQSYALISDAATHTKMACGDPKAGFRVAILDPCLTVSQPASVTAITGYDAIAHAVETYVTTKRNPISDIFSREAWRLLESNFERVLSEPTDLKARAGMQLGAYFAGVAIENSMLGATHACANPLTAHYDTTHGVAIAVLLPWVVRWNASIVEARYGELAAVSNMNVSTNGHNKDRAASEQLAHRLEQLAEAGKMPRTLSAAGISKGDLNVLAEEAAQQWTGRFNPRPFDSSGALEVYRCAF